MKKLRFIETNQLSDNRFLGWDTHYTYIVKDENGFFTIQYKFINGMWKSFINGQIYNLSDIEGTLITDISKQADFLYTLKYQEYNYEWALNHFKSIQNPIIGACSSFRKNDIYARNFDWYYSNSIEFVIKTPHTDKYKATLGVTLSNTLLYPSYNSNNWYEEYKVLPFTIVDGINEDGVFCNINVVNAIEEGFVRTTGTTPTEEKRLELCMLMMPRYILDNFSTALEAIEYIEDYVSVYAPSVTPDYEYHFMIGDRTSTYVVEFINNALVYEKVNYDEDHPAILTNFRITDVTLTTQGYTPIVDYTTVEDYGTGIERYNVLLDKIGPGITIQSAMNLMSTDLKFTNAYGDLYLDRLTEYAGEYTSAEHTERLTVTNAFTQSDYSKFTYILNIVGDKFTNRSRDINNPNYGTWQTVHTSVYDLSTKILTLRIQEDNTRTFTFTF